VSSVWLFNEVMSTKSYETKSQRIGMYSCYSELTYLDRKVGIVLYWKTKRPTKLADGY